VGRGTVEGRAVRKTVGPTGRGRMGAQPDRRMDWWADEQAGERAPVTKINDFWQMAKRRRPC
jgi:hypothetical protein